MIGSNDDVTTVFENCLRHSATSPARRCRCRHAVSSTGIEWAMPRAHARAAALPCLAHLDRVAELAPPAEQAAGRAACAPTPPRFALGPDLHRRRFRPGIHRQLRLAGSIRHARPFRQRQRRGRLPDPRPDIVYPDHHHVAEEIYIPLTGGHRMADGRRRVSRIAAAGEVIHHASNVNHAMRTGPEPLLALYLWRGGPLARARRLPGRPRRAGR